MQVQHRDVQDTRRPVAAGRKIKSHPKPPRAPVWRPQASGLTRAELRQIVEDTLG